MYSSVDGDAAQSVVQRTFDTGFGLIDICLKWWLGG
jgi:hypothetical protein